MINSKKIYSFFKRKTCDEDEKKNTSTSTKLENFMRIQELKKMKNKYLKFLEFHIMNLKIHNVIYGSILK